MLNSTLFFLLSTPTYLLSFAFYLFQVVLSSERSQAAVAVEGGVAGSITADGQSGAWVRSDGVWGRWARRAAWLGVGLSTIGVVWRTIELGQASNWALTVFLPVTTTYETLTFFAWIIPLTYLGFDRRSGFPGVAMIVTFIAVAMLAAAALPTVAPRAVAPVVPALQSYWLVAHVLMMMVAIALFTSGFGATLLVAWRSWRGGSAQALRPLERFGYRANALGFLLYGVGGIVLGGIWAKYAWGAYWEWDPKETAMLIAWLAYAVYLHARVRWGGHDRWVRWLCLIAYGTVLYAWIGINYFVSSLHSFA